MESDRRKTSGKGTFPIFGHRAKLEKRGLWADSLDWFSWDFCGNHGFYHQIWEGPVNFPLNQSYEAWVSMIPWQNPAELHSMPWLGPKGVTFGNHGKMTVNSLHTKLAITISLLSRFLLP